MVLRSLRSLGDFCIGSYVISGLFCILFNIKLYIHCLQEFIYPSKLLNSLKKEISQPGSGIKFKDNSIPETYLEIIDARNAIILC